MKRYTVLVYREENVGTTDYDQVLENACDATSENLPEVIQSIQDTYENDPSYLVSIRFEDIKDA